MKPNRLLLGLFLFTVQLLPAAILPPEKLLPKDTVLVFTLPDAAKWTAGDQGPFSRLWQDPAMKPFKDKFVAKFQEGFLGPLERTLGVQFSDYRGLAQGQVTFALLPVAPSPDHPASHFAGVFLLDTKDRSGQLRTNLADIRQKWMAAGKSLRTRKIREIDFTTLILAPGDLSWDKLLPAAKSAPADADAEAKTNKVEITFGQFDSLLLVSQSPEVIEKILARQAGGLTPPLAESPAFQSEFNARLHDSPSYAWADVHALVDVITKANAAEGEEMSASPFRIDSIFGVTGLADLNSASASYRSTRDGVSSEVFLALPVTHQRGLVKALIMEPKDASPPPFVPADAAKFWRWRVDLPGAWGQIEKMLADISPQYGAILNFVLQTAGKDRDDKYDLKTELLDRLGDDIIHYEKAPHGGTAEELRSPPSIYLIGSPSPEKLAAALKTGLSFMGPAKQRDFLGRQIYTITSPPQAGSAPHYFSLVGSGSYVAISSDNGILEEYLRSNENKAKPLSETPGLVEAAQKVGGMNTGYFSYQNSELLTRPIFDTLRRQNFTVMEWLGLPPIMGTVNMADQMAKIKDWTDFSLLPPYDAVSRYFYFTVMSARSLPDGISIASFNPTPPKLR